MIKQLGNNDVYEMAGIALATGEADVYHGYYRNDAQWLTHAIKHVREAIDGNPHYIAIKDVDKNGKMLGFMIASTFNEYYSNQYVMDVKEMMVDYEAGRIANAKSVIRCFDYMIEHIKKHGGTQWRADSIHSEDNAFDYARFLQKRYGSAIHTSSRGVVT